MTKAYIHHTDSVVIGETKQEDIVYIFEANGSYILMANGYTDAMKTAQQLCEETGDRFIVARYLTECKKHDDKVIWRSTKLIDEAFKMAALSDLDENND